MAIVTVEDLRPLRKERKTAFVQTPRKELSSERWEPKTCSDTIPHTSLIIDSKELKHGCRMIDVGSPSLVRGWRTAMVQLSGFYCRATVEHSAAIQVTVAAVSAGKLHQEDGTCDLGVALWN